VTDGAVILARVEGRVRGYGRLRAIVAFSGGVDSSVVLAAAARALGPRSVTAITAVSPSYPRGELDGARCVARGLGVGHRVIWTHEVEREAYARNDGMRCFHCKTELFAAIERIAALGAGRDSTVLTGANADDATDVRPGLRAGDAFGVRSPLLDEGIGKDGVRAIAGALDLPVADKPALACLSSRVAFGIRVTPDLLDRIDRAERAVRALGFDPVRVRHFGAGASVEVEPRRVGDLLRHEGLPQLLASLRAFGWERVDVDLAGYRPGRMNATLLDATVPRG
jgi:pyridinium-3,5-biscarboxylic acid mononucleotide sulfurtransferase